MTKVSSGLYNGKPYFYSLSQAHLPVMAFILLINTFKCEAISQSAVFPHS